MYTVYSYQATLPLSFTGWVGQYRLFEVHFSLGLDCLVWWCIHHGKIDKYRTAVCWTHGKKFILRYLTAPEGIKTPSITNFLSNWLNRDTNNQIYMYQNTPSHLLKSLISLLRAGVDILNVETRVERGNFTGKQSEFLLHVNFNFTVSDFNISVLVI